MRETTVSRSTVTSKTSSTFRPYGRLDEACPSAIRAAPWSALVSIKTSPRRIFQHTAIVGDDERAAEDLSGAIRLGYESERNDPNVRFEVPPDDEIRWLGEWLASEGFTRPRNGASIADRLP